MTSKTRSTPFVGPAQRLFRVVMFTLIVPGIIMSLRAAEPNNAVKKNYDIPAASALQAMKEFSEQSGAEVLYSASDLEGIKTNTINGSFIAPEALELLLARTPLIFTVDPKTEGFAIRREGQMGSSSQSATQEASTGATTTKTVETGPSTAEVESSGPGGAPELLSPFVVDTTKDEGYRATNTLAGSRINTPLKDLANPITIVTKDFFDDLQAVDINDILSYTVSSEGLYQYVGTDNFLGAPEDISATNRQTENRLRGLSPADISMDYFSIFRAAHIGFDTYNLDEVTINRGPNSVLFGEGSASGDIDYEPQLASFGKNKSELTFRFGSFGDARSTLNANYVLKPDVFAIRVAAEWGNVGFEQQPAHDRDNRVYLALTYHPFPKTTIRAHFENVTRDIQPPNSFTPADYVTPWVKAGSPSYALATTPPGIDQFNTIVIDSNGKIEGAREGIDSAGYNEFNALNLEPIGFYVPGVSSNKWYNVEKTNTYNLDDNAHSTTFEASVDQELLPGLNFNLGFFSQRYSETSIGLLRAPVYDLVVDNAKTYGDGTPNPHFGELAIDDWQTNALSTWPERDTQVRATLTYQLDLRTINKWLGHYTLTGFAESLSRDAQTNSYGEDVVNEPTAFGGYYDGVNRRYYIGGSANSPATNPANPAQVPSLVANIPFVYYSPVSNSWTSGALSTEYIVRNLNEDVTKINTRAFVAQVYLIPWLNNDLLIGTVGVRSDIDSDANRNISGSITGTLGNYTLINQTLPQAFNAPLYTQRQTNSVGIVCNPEPWLSLHFAHSENFLPNAGNIDLLGNSTPAPVGTSKDYGFAVSLFHETLNIKVNWWDEKEANGSDGSTASTLGQWTIPDQDALIGAVVQQQLGLPYNYINSSPNHPSIGDPRLQNGYTADNSAKGVEFEMTYNVTRNWRIMMNASRQYDVLTDIAPGLIAITNERIKYWDSIPGLLNTPLLGTTNLHGGWGPTGESIGQIILDNVILEEVQVEAQEGQPSTQLSKYRANAMTNYQFDHGMLKNFNVGGGVQIASRPIVGDPYTYAVVDGTVAPNGLDVRNPYLGNTPWEFEGWVGYKRMIANGKYLLSFQLNARNLNSSGGLEVIAKAGPNAQGQAVNEVYALKQPRTFLFETKLDY